MVGYLLIRARILFCAVLLMLAFVPSASAQRVVGTVVDAGSERAIEEFTVHLMDSQGRSVAAALSQPGGRFVLTAPTAGEYTVLVLRIGFRRTSSDPLTLHAGEVVQQRLRMVQVPARLEAIRVDDTPQCEASRQEGTGFVAVWDEIEKAVQVVALTQNAPPLEMTVRNHYRDVSLRSGATLAESSEVRIGRTRAPYVNPEPEEIARTGYVQRGPEGTTYLAPDARTLLSPSFVGSHCFTLVSDAEHGHALIGVAFAPVTSRSVPDIRGTLWVDRRSGELRTLDFTYTGLPTAARSRPYGGHVSFRHITGGAWIIGSWRVRAPYVDVVVQRLREQGGEVLAVRGTDGSVLWASSYSAVQGVVRDSSTHSPIPGVSVSLRGTPRRVVTSAAGQFALDSVPPGEYSLVAELLTPSGTTVSSVAPVRISAEPSMVSLGLPYSASISRDSIDALARVAKRCRDLRTARERLLSEEFSRATNRWTPSGTDSATQAKVFRGASTVLQAIGDTTGRVDLSTARALKRESQAGYVEALNALAQLRPTVDEPLPGCKLRALVLLPYRVHAER